MHEHRSPLRLHKFLAVWAPALFTLDVVWAGLSGYLVAFGLAELRAGPHLWPLRPGYSNLLISMPLVMGIVLHFLGAYRPWRGGHLMRELRTLALAWVWVFVIFVVLAYLSKTGQVYSRLWIVVWFCMGFLGMGLVRVALRKTLRWSRQQGRDGKRLVLVGGGEIAERVLEKLKKYPWLGLEPIGYFDSEIAVGQMAKKIRYLGELSSISSYLDRREVDQVWIVLPISQQERIRQLVQTLEGRAVDIRLVPDIYSYSLLNQSVDIVVGMPLINLSASPQVGLDALAKRSVDIVGSTVALVLFLPLMLLIASCVIWSSGSPIIFRQSRHGWDGRPFDMYKFRTMAIAQATDQYQQVTRDDFRVTAVGRFLRRSSLDELPQLFNVIKGDMSLVGPRPHPVQMNEHYIGKVDRFMARHKVKPGMTGWAQISGYRGETDSIEKIRQRIEYDLFYIQNWSLFLDIKILFMTIYRGFGGRNVY